MVTGIIRKTQGIKKNHQKIFAKHHKNEKFLEKENKETPFVILTFLVFTFNINAVLTKNKKDHIKMLKLGQSRPLKVYNRNHQKNPRNKKRTIKKSLQNIIKMKNS